VGIDAAVDFEFFARASAVLCYLSGAVVRVGLHGTGAPAPYRGDLMTHRIRYDPNLHTSQLFLLMVEAIGVPSDKVHELLDAPPPTSAEYPRFAVEDAEMAELRSRLRNEAATEEPFPLVLLNANASDLIPLRRWPTECYVQLARRLLDAYPTLYIAFTGSPEERCELEPVMKEIGSDRCFCMAGRTTLRELLVLYHLAEVLVTNDSGPAHFAALTPIETVTLFGPETPALFGAQSPRSHILWKGTPCSPCVTAYNNRVSTCRNNRCLQDIGVDEVFHVVSRLLTGIPER
jgi:ADP-heptose:LPS heptosyltransferase